MLNDFRDALEHDAGLPADKIVEAHGTFHTAHCLNPSCAKEYTRTWITGTFTLEYHAHINCKKTKLELESLFTHALIYLCRESSN